MGRALCPECLRVAEYDSARRTDTFEIRGEQVAVEADVAVCRLCGGEIGLPELDDAAYAAAYAIYRARHGFMQPGQIRALRSKYGLGQKAFAKLLGWGEVTLARYEQGALQSNAHDQTLHLSENPAYIRQMFARNGTRLTSAQADQLTNRLAALSAVHETLLVREESAAYVSNEGVRKLREMMVYFAGHEDMWRTKLSQMLFYADYLHVKRHGVSISGARYVNMQFGPVPADFYTLQAALIDDGSLDERCLGQEDCSGTVFVANRPADTAAFSDLEMQTLRDVVGTFAGWSASRMTDYAHQEPGWATTRTRETIDYRFAKDVRLT